MVLSPFVCSAFVWSTSFVSCPLCLLRFFLYLEIEEAKKKKLGDTPLKRVQTTRAKKPALDTWAEETQNREDEGPSSPPKQDDQNEMAPTTEGQNEMAPLTDIISVCLNVPEELFAVAQDTLQELGLLFDRVNKLIGKVEKDDKERIKDVIRSLEVHKHKKKQN